MKTSLQRHVWENPIFRLQYIIIFIYLCEVAYVQIIKQIYNIQKERLHFSQSFNHPLHSTTDCQIYVRIIIIMFYIYDTCFFYLELKPPDMSITHLNNVDKLHIVIDLNCPNNKSKQILRIQSLVAWKMSSFIRILF